MVTGIRVNETGSDRPPFENLSTYTPGIWQANGFLSRNFYPLFQNQF